MLKVKINGHEIEVDQGATVLQACEQADSEIPRFCYHERLSIAGNCRMCLVEIKGMPKPIASCAMNVRDLRPGPNGEPPEVLTNSQVVKTAREGVMEFLLVNHPLDCPICDQGGECDLQDQAMAYGIDTSRFDENKRGVENKYIGPVIKTQMTRCIHCTRCVRFMTEIAGVEELGAIGRGEDMEITTYLEKGIHSELSGNIIDLCPVGALTSRPFAFTARPWELNKVETIDVMDGMGANIRIDSRSDRVLRIQPRNNDDVNEEWLSDKSRFVWDGLAIQRLDTPYARINGSLKPVSWDEALNIAKETIQTTASKKCAALVGDLAGVEEMFALKQFTQSLGWEHIDSRQDDCKLHPDLGRETYLFNSTINGIEHADLILLVGANPRHEASLLNARIRQNWLHRQIEIGVIGQVPDLYYDFDHLGADIKALNDLLAGKSAFASKMKAAKKPMMILGAAATRSDEATGILAACSQLATSYGFLEGQWNGINILHQAASRVGAFDLGFVPKDHALQFNDLAAKGKNGDIDLFYLLGADEFDMDLLGDAFVIYQGSHGDKGASRADLIFPAAAYSEKNATYVNFEGRSQMTQTAILPPGDAKEDWAIIRALSGKCEKPLAYNTLQELRGELYKSYPHFANLGQVGSADTSALQALAELGRPLPSKELDCTIDNYFTSNPIARCSKVLADIGANLAKVGKADEGAKK